MNHSLISVIIPAYQHRETLPRCLESVFQQTYPFVEIIVVNDGSTDGTKELLETYKNSLTVLNQENQGGNIARNNGFVLSKGSRVIFCDADAVMRPDMLARMAAKLDVEPDATFVYSAFRFGWKRFPSFPFDAERLKRMNYIHTTSLIRREQFPGFDSAIKRFQDWDLWLTILERGGRGTFIQDELFQIVEISGRRGISQWRPSIMYHIPWKWTGWTPSSVEKYGNAREIILKKHGL